MVEEEVVAVVGEVVVAAEEDLVHLSQLRWVDAIEDIQHIGKRHKTQRSSLIVGSAGGGYWICLFARSIYASILWLQYTATKYLLGSN